jgi:glycosidase
MSYPEVVIDPPFWWCGMKNPKLMLFVNGPSISAFVPAISHAGVVVDRVTTLDSPHYQAIYLDISQASAGTFEIVFRSRDDAFSKSFELKSRSPKLLPDTFSSADVIYLFMPDRFSRGRPAGKPAAMGYPYHLDRSNLDIRHGGDLAGVAQHLDYVADLGVTCLWPTPVFENDIYDGSYHGYSITNYYVVDPRFGTNEEFAALVRAAHLRGLKVIADLVFNHCASTHPWAIDPPSGDWFHFPGVHTEACYDVSLPVHAYVSAFDLGRVKDHSFTIDMPDLNQRQPELACYLTQMSIWWVEFAELNGIRMDTFAYCDGEMMRDWAIAVDAEFPGFNIVGECWTEVTASQAWFQRGNTHNPYRPGLPSVMDFRLCRHMTDFLGKPDGLMKLYKHLGHDWLYPDVFRVLRFLENHDKWRFLRKPPADLRRFRKAMLVLLTIPGIPQLYCGTEVLMAGKCKPTDGAVRKDFPGGWDGDQDNWFVAEGRSQLQNEAFGYLRKLLHWRKGNQIVAQGKTIMFQPKEGALIYERRIAQENVIVVVNGQKAARVETESLLQITRGRRTWFDVIGEKEVAFGDILEIPADDVWLLEPRAGA